MILLGSWEGKKKQIEDLTVSDKKMRRKSDWQHVDLACSAWLLDIGLD